MKLNNTSTTTQRLGAYLTAAVSCSTIASTASAAVVSLDISSIDGINGGVATNTAPRVALSSLSEGALTGSIAIYNTPVIAGWGIVNDVNAMFAVLGDTYASPKNFSSGDLIDVTASFSAVKAYSIFGLFGAVSPDFGAGSFMGFRSGNGHYGYLEVTWTSATDTFQILSGAYESVAGVGITAGAAPVPEPSTAVLSLGALAAGAFIRRRKQAA